MNNQEFSFPQVLSGSVDVDFSTVTRPSYAQLNLDVMSTRSRRWFLAERLSIQVSPLTVTPLSPTDRVFYSVKMKSSAYRQDLTRAYTNIQLLGPSTFFVGEFSSSGNINTVVGGGGTILPSTMHTRWIFPRPFLLPPGDAFSAQFEVDPNNTNVAEGTVRISVALCGKVISEDLAGTMFKGRNPLPYVTSFEPPNSLTIPAYTESSNLELANPFTRPLFGQRITSQPSTFYLPDGAGAYNNIFGSVNPSSWDIELKDTRTMVAERQNMSTLFHPQASAWTFNRVLNPTEYLKAKIWDNRISGAAATYIPSIALIGYREVSV